jgi:hypothetical protein
MSICNLSRLLSSQLFSIEIWSPGGEKGQTRENPSAALAQIKKTRNSFGIDPAAQLIEKQGA